MGVFENKKNLVAGTGISTNTDAFQAGKEAVEMALRDLGAAPDFALVFANGKKYGDTKKTVEQLVKGVDKTLKGANKKVKWIGCTSTSEMIGNKTVDDSCVVLTVKSDYIHVGTAIMEIGAKDPRLSGRKIIKSALMDLKRDKDFDLYTLYLAKKKMSVLEDIKINPYYFLYLPSGVTNTSFLKANEVIWGFLDEVGPSLQLIGGSAADNFAFKDTYQFADGKIANKGVALMVMYSNLYVGLGSSHGFVRHSQQAPLRITKCKDNLLMEINDRNAIEIYAEALNTTVDDVKKNILQYGMDYPLGFLDPEGRHMLVSPFAIANDKYITCATYLTEGTIFDVVKASKNEMLNATESISDSNKKKVKGNPALTICFSCSMRKLKLAKDYVREGEIAKQKAKNGKLIGMYGYAEHITPENGQARMVNETFTSISISDKIIVN
ncbi:MAG: FIST N-terminal domain-containing protein [Nanoarchaeota archaeon]